MKNILVISHKVDNDGFASAAIVDAYYKENYREDEVNIEHLPWNYGMDIPELDHIFEDVDIVWLVDLHWPDDIMHELYMQYGDDFIWVDHHAKCVNDYYAKYPNDVVNGIQSIFPKAVGVHSCSAAELIWYFIYGSKGTKRYGQIFNGLAIQEGKCDYIPDLPNIIALVSDYDAWNNENLDYWNNFVYPFQMGSRIGIANHIDMIKLFDDMKAVDKFYSEHYGGDILGYIASGRNIIAYEKMECTKDINFGGMTHSFVSKTDNREYKAMVLNTTKRSSNVFINMINRDDYDVFICWNMILKKGKPLYKYSMYAFKDDVNCAGLEVNGLVFNGHPHATGGELDRYIFE